MNKLTVVFIVVTIIVVVVLGTLLGIRFFTNQDTEPSTDTTQNEEQIQPETEDEPEEEEPEEEEPVADFPAIVSPFEAVEESEDEEDEESTEPVFSNIDISKIIEAGYDIPDLLQENFDGIIFGSINISDYNDENHSKYIVTEAEEYAGTLVELIFPDPDIANEVYSSIKTKIQDRDAFELNETNQYGDASFFANHSQEKNSVFLVVKKAERLYTLHYPAKNHNKMKNLINLL